MIRLFTKPVSLLLTLVILAIQVSFAVANELDPICEDKVTGFRVIKSLPPPPAVEPECVSLCEAQPGCRLGDVIPIAVSPTDVRWGCDCRGLDDNGGFVTVDMQVS